MKRAALTVFLCLILFAAFASSIPAKTEAASQILTVVSSTQTVSSNIQYPSQLVQPRLQSSYKFTTSGASYFGNNLGDNISLAPSITGFTPALSANSTLMQYSATFAGCTLTIQYNGIQSLTVKQNIIGSNCPIGTFKFNIANLKGFIATASPCSIQYKSVAYSWCNDKLTGVSISYSSGVITITTTSKNWSIDPTIVQSGLIGNCFNVSSCAGSPSALGAGNIYIVAIEFDASLTTCPTISSVTDTRGLTYTNAITVTNGASNTCATTAIYSSSTTTAGADTITVTLSGTGVNFLWYGYEVSGLSNPVSIHTGSQTGSACTGLSGTGSTSFTNGAFLVSVVACQGGGGSFTDGMGFTGIGGGSVGRSEYSITVNSPTTFPMTSSAGTGRFAYVGVAFDPQPPILVSWNINPTLSSAGEILLNVGGVITTILSSSTITYSASTIVTVSAIPFGDFIFHQMSIVAPPAVAQMTTYNPTNTVTISPSAATTETGSIIASFANSIATASSASTASTASTAGGAPQTVIPVTTPDYTLPALVGGMAISLLVAAAFMRRRR